MGIGTLSSVSDVTLGAQENVHRLTRLMRSEQDREFLSIRSKERVSDVGEVFTPDSCVINMMDLDHLRELSYHLCSTFLEPSCGTGNFLVEILARKLAVAIYAYRAGIADLDLLILQAVATVYGVDIMFDNVHESRSRLLQLVEYAYSYTMANEQSTDGEVTKVTMPSSLKKNVNYILKTNIIFGDMLKFEMAKSEPDTKHSKKAVALSLSELSDDNKDEMYFIKREFSLDGTVKQTAIAAKPEDTVLGSTIVCNYSKLYATDLDELTGEHDILGV